MRFNNYLDRLKKRGVPIKAKKLVYTRKAHMLVKQTINYYNENAKDFFDETVGVGFGEIQDMFLEYVLEGGTILDFGCGSGRDIKYFLHKGYAVEAVDGSEELCKLAREYTGISVNNMMFEELNSVEMYDGIWACASILHVAKVDLPVVIKKMANAVKKNGAIYISFKYGNFEGCINGRYFTCFTEESFIQTIENIPELIIEKLWVTSDVRVGRREEQWLNLILMKRDAD